MKEPPEEHTDSDDYEMETVLLGSWAEVLVLQAALEDQGIQTFIPNQNIKTIDPYITGMNALDVRLQVPRLQFPLAAEALTRLREEKQEGHDPELLFPVEALGRRVRWATLILPPVGLVFGILYLLKTRPMQTKPIHHGRTLAAVWICLGLTAFGCYILGKML